MAYFLVTYDLVEDKDYKKLIDELKELGAHRPALSVWFVELKNTAVEVKDHLAGYMDRDDKLIVVEFSKRPATKMAFEGTKDWLDARF
jgi:CRISPR-associated endonuclease Cas2